MNLGFDHGNNYAAKFARGKYLLFLNNDALVEKNLLVEAARILDRDESIAMASPLIYYYPSLEIQYAGGRYSDFNLIPDKNIHSYLPDHLGIITDYPSGCALFLRKSAVRNYPFIFDPRTFFLGEEVDLSYRIKNDGHKIMCFFSSKVLHYTSRSSPKKMHVYYMIRNRFLYIGKYVPTKKIVPAAFFALLYAFLYLKFLPRLGKTCFFTIKDAVQDGLSSLHNIKLRDPNAKVFCRRYIPHLANVSQFRH
jgi:GT2 family glycosyltransferase